MKDNFTQWLSTMRETLLGYADFVNFEKIYASIDSFPLKISLSALDSLLGAKNIEEEFYRVLKTVPEVRLCIPLLLAKRNADLKTGTQGIIIPVLGKDNIVKKYDFSMTSTLTDEEYAYFMRESGLFDLMSNRDFRSVRDYVLGIEVGLDTHARKNRVGMLMENSVRQHLKLSGVDYAEQVTRKQAAEWGLEPAILKLIYDSLNKVDFVACSNGQYYFIEVNFFSGGGSKLSAIARLFKKINKDLSKKPNIHFIWITDGCGWLKCKDDLKKAYLSMPFIFNLSDLENGALNQLF